MPESVAFLLCIAILAVGSALVVWYALRSSQPQDRASGQSSGSVAELTCASCSKPLVINRADLTELSKPEIALSVRAQPKLSGKKLVEYVCPYCEASHCFAVEGRRLEWVGMNLYSPHGGGARCMDCGKPLRTAPWPPGTYDGRLNEAPAMQPDYGLVCSKCHAIVCYGCTQLATRGRTKDGTLVCPRCQRSPVDKTYHPV